MSETSYSTALDLKEAQAMADGLEEYVRGNELYGRAGGFFSLSQMPSLTVGALRMRLRRLAAQRDQLSSEQAAQLDGVMFAHDRARREWRRHYDEKMEREARSRLKAMETFFEELRDNPRIAASSYLPEAMRRTIVEELLIAMREADLNVEAIERDARAIDGRLRRWVAPGEFLWSAVLSPVYPQAQFWWLYSRPNVQEDGRA